MRLVHVDPHPLLRIGVRAALAGTAFDVVGEAATGAAFSSIVTGANADLVLFEPRLPDCDGRSFARLVREHAPGAHAIALAYDDAPEDVQGALAAGAVGFVSKQIPPRDLAAALRAILDGERQAFGNLEPAQRAGAVSEATATSGGAGPAAHDGDDVDSGSVRPRCT